jgi:glycerophosphoryl diester phosphodiesterase
MMGPSVRGERKVSKVYGHRGAPAEFPENTLAGFRRALELGIEGIELDVHLSADGIPVVIHDETVDRTTNGRGAVADLTVEELRALDAGDGEYVPTLAEVLDLMGDNVHVDIEVKANAAGQAVLEEIEGRNTRWLISSFDWDVLRYVRSAQKDTELWVLSPAASDEALDVVDEVGATALAIWERGLDEDVASHLREKSVDFWVWTVNDPRRARECVEWGAIGICTDDPARIRQALED